jgi:hypothetical protein
MIWIAAGLALAAAAAVGRWWLRRYDGLGRRRPFPYLSVAMLALLAVGAAIPPYLRTREEDRLSVVATQLVGGQVRVHCQTAGQEFVDAGAELGYVRWGADGAPEHRTLIKREPCAALRAYLRSSKRSPTESQVVAVHILTHESMHMRGEKDEAVAECEAVQRDARTASLLGASPTQAQELARRYWVVVYPRLSDDYRSSECRSGGALDEHVPGAPWERA